MWASRIAHRTLVSLSKTTDRYSLRSPKHATPVSEVNNGTPGEQRDKRGDLLHYPPAQR